MNTRFSTSECDQPQHPGGRSQPAPDEFIPGLAPLAGCDSIVASIADETEHDELCALDVDEIYVPAHYEPNYAYPLIAWLSPPSGANGRLKRLMRTISERNYFGVSVPVTDPNLVMQTLYETFVRLRRYYHLHTERVYLLGFGDEGTQALQTGLVQPAWFAGVAAISARWPETPRLLAQFDKLRGKRVLLGFGESDSAAIVADALYMRQLLWCAGMHVTALATRNRGELHDGLLREIDRWIMQSIEQPEPVC